MILRYCTWRLCKILYLGCLYTVLRRERNLHSMEIIESLTRADIVRAGRR